MHQQWLQSALLEALMAKTDIPLPEEFVTDLLDEEMGRLRESFERPDSRRTFAEYLEQLEQTEDELKVEMKTSIEARIRRELVLQQLSKDLEISIDDEELGKIAETEAADYNEDPVRFTARLKAEDRWEDYRVGKVNERAFAVLAETAVITETAEEEEE